MDTAITIFSPVNCNAEYSEAPGGAVIRLTLQDLDRIERLSKILKDEQLSTVTYSFWADMFDKMPAYDFDELGKKFVMLFDESEPVDMGEEKDPDAEFNYERISSMELVVGTYGFYVIAFAKHTDNIFSTGSICIESVRKIILDQDETPREDFYFHGDKDSIPAFEDLPKMLNADLRLSTYAKEKLKRGV